MNGLFIDYRLKDHQGAHFFILVEPEELAPLEEEAQKKGMELVELVKARLTKKPAPAPEEVEKG